MAEGEKEECVEAAEEEMGESDMAEVGEFTMEQLHRWVEELREELKHNISQFHEIARFNERIGTILQVRFSQT